MNTTSNLNTMTSNISTVRSNLSEMMSDISRMTSSGGAAGDVVRANTTSPGPVAVVTGTSAPAVLGQEQELVWVSVKVTTLVLLILATLLTNWVLLLSVRYERRAGAELARHALIAHLLHCVTHAVPAAVQVLYRGGHLLQRYGTVCRLSAFCNIFISTLITTTVLVILLERNAATSLWKPAPGKTLTATRITAIILITWIYALLFSMPVLVGVINTKVYETFYQCRIEPTMSSVYIVLVAVFSICIPLVTILLTMIVLQRTINKLHDKVEQLQHSQSKASSGKRNAYRTPTVAVQLSVNVHSPREPVEQIVTSIGLAKSSMNLSIAFVLLFVPYIVLFQVVQLSSVFELYFGTAPVVVPDEVVLVLTWLSMLYPVILPFTLYRDGEIWNRFKDTFTYCCCKARSNAITDNSSDTNGSLIRPTNSFRIPVLYPTAEGVHVKMMGGSDDLSTTTEAPAAVTTTAAAADVTAGSIHIATVVSQGQRCDVDLRSSSRDFSMYSESVRTESRLTTPASALSVTMSREDNHMPPGAPSINIEVINTSSRLTAGHDHPETAAAVTDEQQATAVPSKLQKPVAKVEAKTRVKADVNAGGKSKPSAPGAGMKKTSSQNGLAREGGGGGKNLNSNKKVAAETSTTARANAPVKREQEMPPDVDTGSKPKLPDKPNSGKRKDLPALQHEAKEIPPGSEKDRVQEILERPASRKSLPALDEHNESMTKIDELRQQQEQREVPNYPDPKDLSKKPELPKVEKSGGKIRYNDGAEMAVDVNSKVGNVGDASKEGKGKTENPAERTKRTLKTLLIERMSTTSMSGDEQGADIGKDVPVAAAGSGGSKVNANPKGVDDKENSRPNSRTKLLQVT